MTEGSKGSQEIGWARALLTSAIVALVATGLLVYVPNLILIRWTAIVRSARITLAVVWFFATLSAIAASMHMLQKRRIL